MGVLVVVPWRPGCPHREGALRWVSARWANLGHELRLGVHESGEWCKAEAVRTALADADVLVMTDADVWCDGVVEAIDRVRAGAPWVIPHDKLYRLSEEATGDVLAGAEPHEGMPLARLAEGVPGFAYKGQAGGGIVVMRRDVYDDSPLDPRFTGWDLEDAAWDLALRCLHGLPARLGHRLWHLWHPPQANRGVGTEQGRQLHKRYVRAKRRPDQMRALIAEGRTDADPSGDRQHAGHLSERPA